MRVRDPITGRNIVVTEEGFEEWKQKNWGVTPKKVANPANDVIIRLVHNVVRETIKSGSVSTNINANKQLRHIKGSPEYIDGRSYLSGTLEDAQKIVDEYSGTGTPIYDAKGKWTNKERIETEKNIGVHIDPETKEETATTKATIVYSKTGSHVIPRKDNKK